MSTKTDYTTVTLPREEKDRLDDAAKDLFESDEVPYRVTLKRLIEDHPQVSE